MRRLAAARLMLMLSRVRTTQAAARVAASSTTAGAVGGAVAKEVVFPLFESAGRLHHALSGERGSAVLSACALSRIGWLTTCAPRHPQLPLQASCG
jgi:hypothetical protein